MLSKPSGPLGFKCTGTMTRRIMIRSILPLRRCPCCARRSSPSALVSSTVSENTLTRASGTAYVAHFAQLLAQCCYQSRMTKCSLSSQGYCLLSTSDSAPRTLVSSGAGDNPPTLAGEPRLLKHTLRTQFMCRYQFFLASWVRADPMRLNLLWR